MYEKIRSFYEDNVNIFNDLCEWPGAINPEEMLYPMEEFDCFFTGVQPYDIAKYVFNGDFNPYDNYFSLGVYLESFDEKDYTTTHLSDSTIEELAQCVEAELNYRLKHNYTVNLNLWKILYKLYVNEGLIDGDITE